MAKILLIDDEVGFLELVRDYLDSKGYNTITAQSAAEGIKKFKKEKPELVMCDIIMPGRDGWDTIRVIRKINKEIPIIVLSIIHDFEGKKEIYSEPPNYYMSKPISMETLSKSVKKILYEGNKVTI